MTLIKSESIFLLYFLPLFAVKLLDITSDSIILKLTGVISCLLFALNVSQIKCQARLFYSFCILFCYAVILLFTSGKQGFLFSLIMLFVLQDVKQNKRIYKACFIVGLVFLVIACINAREGNEVTRFMNGEWITMVKRSNILYISYTAIVCLYLLIEEKHLVVKHILIVTIISYCMYLYVGSRTGFLAIMLMVCAIVLLNIPRLNKSKIMKYGCVLFPLICFLFCLFSGINYGNNPIWELLNMMLQGRIEQNSAYIERYDIKLFGQHIYESTDVNDFWVLDCAYLDMLICSGLLFLVLWIIFNMIVIKYMYEQNKIVAVSMLLMYAVYGISETFLSNSFLNMSFFIYGQYLYERFYDRRLKI